MATSPVDIELHLEDIAGALGHKQGQYDSMDSIDTPAEVNCPSSIDEKALMRKVDLHVIPMLFLIYLAAFLDR